MSFTPFQLLSVLIAATLTSSSFAPRRGSTSDQFLVEGYFSSALIDFALTAAVVFPIIASRSYCSAFFAEKLVAMSVRLSFHGYSAMSRSCRNSSS